MTKLDPQVKYQRFWQKNRERVNAERRKRYAEDTAYREKMLARMGTEKVKKRRAELRKPHKEKAAEYAKIWRINNPKKHRAALRNCERNRIKNLSDGYIIKLIKDEVKIKTSEIPKQLIDIMRINIKTKRLLKKRKQND